MAGTRVETRHEGSEWRGVVEKAVHNLLLELPQLSCTQLTDPCLLVYLRALGTASVAEKILPTAAIRTSLDHVVTSLTDKLPVVSSRTTGSITTLMQAANTVSEFLRILAGRCEAALSVGAHLLGTSSLSNSLECVFLQCREIVTSLVSSFPSLHSETPCSVSGELHLLLVTISSCCEMGDHLMKMFQEKPNDKHVQDASSSSSSSSSSFLFYEDVLCPLLQAAIVRTCPIFSALVEELCRDDEQCLISCDDGKLLYTDRHPTKVLLGSAYLTKTLEMSVRLLVAGIPVSGIPQLVHTALLGLQTYTCRLVQVASRVPDSGPLTSWYIIISSLDYIYTSLNELYVHSDPLPQSMVELSKLCRWIGQHCDAVVTRAIAYHQQLCSTSLLHDADCHNWQSNRPFSEGERVSYTVQAWYFHMKALLHDLTNHTPSMYTTRITSEVLVHSVTMVTNYYMQLKPSSARIPQYRADMLAVLVMVASLLPHVYPFNSTAHELTLINERCLTLLTQALSSSGGVPVSNNWQQCLNLSHFGLASDNKTVSLVSFQPTQWGLLVELLLQRKCQLVVALCRHGLLASCAHILSHCHHQPTALAGVFKHVTTSSVWHVSHKPVEHAVSNHSSSVSSAAITWVKEMVEVSLIRPTQDAAVQFTASMIHHKIHASKQPLQDVVKSLLIQLLQQLLTGLQQLDQPMRMLLVQLSSGSNDNRPGLQLLGVLLEGVITVPDWVSGRVVTVIGQLWAVFQQLLEMMFLGKEGPHDYPELCQCVSSDAVQDQLTRLSSALSVVGEDYPLYHEVLSHKINIEPSLLHSTAADVVRSDDRGRQVMEDILQWVVGNKDTLISIEEKDELTLQATPEPAEIDLFDPVKTCCTLGLRHFDSQNFISLQILQ